MLTISFLPFYSTKFKKDLKFSEEGRFSFGVCVRKNTKDEEEGIRLEVFDYTCMNILSIPKYEAMIRAEIARVLGLSSIDRVKQRWVGDHERPKGSIWMDDSVEYLKGIGKSRLSKLNAMGITKISDVAELDDVQMKHIQQTTGIGVSSLKTY